MQGHFDLRMFDSPGLTQDVIEAVRKEGGDPAVDDYLNRFQTEGEWHTDNQVYRVLPSAMYYWAWGSCPSAYGPMASDNYSTSSVLGFITLSNYSSEVSYTSENWTSSSTPDSTPTSVGSGASKRFINDNIVSPQIASDPYGRESIFMKNRWLYLPGQATSDQIKSICVYYCEYFSNWGAPYERCRIARVRIKDSGNNPVTLNKVATKSLLVEYTFTLASI